MSGLWLGIETTGSVGGVAVVRDGCLLSELMLPVRATTSEKVLPAVERALELAGGGRPDGVAVSTGPGSYTGLRIGVATAEGLASGWDALLAGVPTLRAMACAAGPGGPVLASVRARDGEVFATVLEDGEPDARELLPAGVYVAETLVEAVRDLDGMRCVGGGRSELGGLPPRSWLPRPMDVPGPSLVAWLGELAGGGRESRVSPLYLRDFGERACDDITIARP